MLIVFALVIGVIAVFDILTWVASIATIKIYSGAIPLGYCVIFLLLPAFFAKLVEPKPVPERVTFK